MKELIFAFITGAASLAVIVFLLDRNRAVKKTRQQNTVRNEEDRKRIEANIAKHGEEVRRIMEKINRYRNVLIFVIPASLAGAQPASMKIPPLNYKDVLAINQRGPLLNYADSIVVISPERYRFYEGLILDAVQLSEHYEAMLSGKDSLLQNARAQLVEADDLLKQCGDDLEELRRKKAGGWFGTTGKMLATGIIAIIAVMVYAKVF